MSAVSVTVRAGHQHNYARAIEIGVSMYVIPRVKRLFVSFISEIQESFLIWKKHKKALQRHLPIPTVKLGGTISALRSASILCGCGF